MVGLTVRAGSRRPKGTGSVRETTTGVWRVRVYVGPDPITQKPRQVERTVRGTKSAAEAQRRRLEREVSEGKHLGVKGTVADLLEAWLDHLERIGRRPATVETYRTVIQAHVLPTLGGLQLRKLTAYDLDAYYASKAQVGGNARQKSTGLGPNTIRQHHALLSSALTQAVKWGWIDKNPAAAASPPGKKKSGRRAPEPAQIRALIEACGDDIDLATAVALGAITGARRGELCGLQWRDVDWGEARIRFERQRVPGKGGDQTRPLKGRDGGDAKTLSLGPGGVAVLRRYAEALTARATQLGIEPDSEGWLLSYDCGHTPMNAKGLGHAITALGKRAGLPVTTHYLRYFAATQMVGAGVDVRTAAGRLGHTPEMLLRVYADFMPSRDLEAARGLEAMVLGPQA